MKKNYVYAQTQSKNDYKQDKKITANQWKIYYYLLSISNYDSQRVEDHRFVYKSDFSVTEMCKELGIKSKQTYYNAMERLAKRGLIANYDKYILIFVYNWIEINLDVLKALLKIGINEPQNIDLLRTFLIIKKIYKFDKEKSFTIKDIVELLGHNKNDSIYYDNVREYLKCLVFWKMMEVKTHNTTVSNRGQFTVYHLQWVSDQHPEEELFCDRLAEMDGSILAEEIKKILTDAPDIIED